MKVFKRFYYYLVFYGVDKKKNFRLKTDAMKFVEDRENLNDNCVVFRCVRRVNGTFDWQCVYDTQIAV